MEIINLNNHYSVVNNYMAELRDCDYQRNPLLLSLIHI